MEQTVENKVVEMLDALQQGAVKVGDAVVQYSPDAVDAALWVIQIDAAQQLLHAFTWLIIALVFVWLNIKFTRCIHEADEWDEAWGFSIPGWMLNFAVGVYAVINLTEIWTWVAVFEPKLALAKKIMEAAL